MQFALFPSPDSGPPPQVLCRPSQEWPGLAQPKGHFLRGLCGDAVQLLPRVMGQRRAGRMSLLGFRNPGPLVAASSIMAGHPGLFSPS